MSHVTTTAKHNPPTLPANETWISPAAPRNRAATLGQGIALTANFAATLIKRAYAPPHPTRTPKHPAPQPTNLAPKPIPHSTPTR